MTFSAKVEKFHNTWVTRLVTDDYYEIPFERILANADPANWPRAFPKLWSKMISNGTSTSGHSRFIEHVHWWGCTQRVPLRFWKDIGENDFHINYEIDPDPVNPRRVDRLITIDQGYIRVERTGTGVRYQTSKQLAVMGASAWLYAKSAKTLGYYHGQQEFVVGQANLLHPKPFVASEVKV